jgi:choline dehydrogenase-like flavoprotein
LSLGLPNAKILLLESGPSALDEIRINIPGFRGSILGTNYDWNFTTTGQAALEGRKIDVNRGKVLGGSSAMNYLCYDRAASAEYEAWSQLGSPGWTWNNFIVAMKKSENFTGSDGDVHGFTGPIKNTYNRVVFDILKAWQPTVSQLGVPVNDGGSIGGNPIGVMFQPTNIDVTKYTRSYSANSYLPLAKSNLVVRVNTHVAKVVLEKCNGKIKASGVTLADGTTILASKEVILSAGSIQSPGLLELSGIGQPAVIKAAGITPLVELAGVGENYQDHIRVSNTYRLKAGHDTFDPYIYESSGANATGELQKWLNGEVSMYDYTTAAYGFMNWAQVGASSQSTVLQAATDAFGSSTNVVDKKKLEFLKDPSVPDIELIYEANYVGAFGYTGGKFITIFSTVMHPMSRGSVHIDPSSPQGKPIIDPKYFSNEHDIRGIIEASKYARKIANTEPMKSLWEAETEPGPDVQTDAQFRDFGVKTMNSFYHPVGTCAMLPKKDGGVVDSNLIVYGTTNLRVVDNSIIPIILSAHIQTAAYGIAEVAAEKIIAAA